MILVIMGSWAGVGGGAVEGALIQYRRLEGFSAMFEIELWCCRHMQRHSSVRETETSLDAFLCLYASTHVSVYL